MDAKTILMVLAVLLGFTGCSSVKVKTEYASGYDFKVVKTYAWQDVSEDILSQPDTYLSSEIPKAINVELSFKGIHEAEEKASADVLLSYYVKVKEEIGYTSASDHGDGRDFSGGIVIGGDAMVSYQKRDPDLNMYGWEIGTLTLLIHDVKTGEQVWRGVAVVELNRSKPEEEQTKVIQKVAEKLMNRYPPIM